MGQTYKVYRYINFGFLALGLLFYSTDVGSIQFNLFLGTSGAMLLLIISSFDPSRYLWTFLAYITFIFGMAEFIFRSGLNQPTLSIAFMGLLIILSLVVIYILRSPATFLMGVLYTFWLLLIAFGVTAAIKQGMSGSFTMFEALESITAIFRDWGWLLFLGGYIASVLPFYLGRHRSTTPRFHTVSGIIVYIMTIAFQVAAGIGTGIFLTIRNYINIFRHYTRKQTPTEAESNEQPAFENYWLRKVFTDWKSVFTITHSENKLIKEELDDQALEINDTFGLTLGSIPFTVLKIAAYSTLWIGLIFLSIASLIHIVIVSLIVIPVFIYYAIFYLYDSYYLRSRKVATICPSCYHQSTLPNYICDECDRVHSNLRAGRFGIRKRTCLCGTELPTTTLDERQELTARCKNEACNSLLRTKEATPFSVSVIGGPSSGKTSFMLSAINELKEKVAPERSWTTEFLQVDEKEIFEKKSEALQLGHYPMKTADKKPFAQNIKITSEQWKNPKLLYLYDPAGEVYSSSEELGKQDYFPYLDGYIFMIDPFSLPDIAATFEEDPAHNWLDVRPSSTLLEDTYAMLIVHLSKRFQIKEGQKITTPLAIVINKVDAFHLDNQIAATKLPNDTNDAKSENELINAQCKAFLANNGYRSFVRQIESKFKTFQFFTSSSSHTKADTENGSSKVITWLMDQ